MVNLEIIIKTLEECGTAVDTQKLALEISFEEAGFDSLDMFNLFVELEQLTGHQIPDEQIDELTTPAALIMYFTRLND